MKLNINGDAHFQIDIIIQILIENSHIYVNKYHCLTKKLSVAYILWVIKIKRGLYVRGTDTTNQIHKYDTQK